MTAEGQLPKSYLGEEKSEHNNDTKLWRTKNRKYFFFQKRTKIDISNKIKYCEWLYFRGVPIFVVFVEGPIHEYKYPRIGDFLYELWK